MNNNLEFLIELVKKSGNCVNLGRSMTVKNPDLFEWVIESTGFLPTDCKFTERIYCIVNSIESRKLNGDGLTYANFVNIFRGYSVKPAPKIIKPKIPVVRKAVKTKFDYDIERIKASNSHLYADNAVLGDDYVVCPETGLRMIIIRKNYITGVLGITVEEYDNKYPGIQKKSLSHSRNISAGVNKVDPATGLTKSQIASKNAQKTLRQIGTDGLSGYQKLGMKTRNTHMNNLDELGRNGYQRQAHARLNTILPSGRTVEQEAHVKQKETILKNNITGSGGASKLSKKVLQPILHFLQENTTKYFFDETEYGIKNMDNGDYYFYDLVIPEYNIAVEYQSTAWHADPTLSLEEWAVWEPPRGLKRKADEVLMYDYNKARALWKFRKIVTYYVWQRTQDKNVEEILCLLKTLNTKS